MLLLVPAVRRQGRDVAQQRHTVAWPLYPWSMFVVVGVGFALRTVAINLSSSPTKGFMTGFQGYVLIPLVYVWLLLWFESSVGRRFAWLPAVLPLALVALAFPGRPDSVAELRYLVLLRDAVGSPVQISLWLLVLHFAYIWFRRLRVGEAGLLAAVCGLAFVDRHSVDWATLPAINLLPLGLAAAWFAVRAFIVRNCCGGNGGGMLRRRDELPGCATRPSSSSSATFRCTLPLSLEC